MQNEQNGLSMSSEEDAASSIIKYFKEYNPFIIVLESIMDEQDVSQSQLSEIIHVTPSTISQWQSSVRFPKADMVYHIAKELSLSEDQNNQLRDSWSVTNSIRSNIRYLEEAFEHKDFQLVIAVAKRISQQQEAIEAKQ